MIFTFMFAATVLSVSSTVSAQGSTCNACNCQFNNIDALAQWIESKIRTIWTNESGKLTT